MLAPKNIYDCRFIGINLILDVSNRGSIRVNHLLVFTKDRSANASPLQVYLYNLDYA
jgi:hypothetical protein